LQIAEPLPISGGGLCYPSTDLLAIVVFVALNMIALVFCFKGLLATYDLKRQRLWRLHCIVRNID